MFDTVARSHSVSRSRAWFPVVVGLHAAAVLSAVWITRLPPAVAKGPEVIMFPPAPGPQGKPATAAAPTTPRPPKSPTKIHLAPAKTHPTQPIEPVEQAIDENPDAADDLADDGSSSGVAGPDLGSGHPSSCLGGRDCTIDPSAHPRVVENVALPTLVMTPPRPSSDCNPPLPRMSQQAREMRIEGRVAVQFEVDADGNARLLRVLSPSAPPTLVDSIREFLERCRFEPTRFGGQATSIRVNQTFNFVVH